MSDRVTAWQQELRIVHQRLRDALDIARESIEEGRDTAPIHAELLIYCWGFCTALSGHHQSEDGTLFPLVLRHRPELAPVVANLVRDHNMIGQLIGELRRALGAGHEKQLLLRHLDGIEAVMETHFGYEERQLAAALAQLPASGLEKEQLLGPIA